MDFNSEDEDDNGQGLTSKSYDSMFMSSLNGEVDNDYYSDEDSTSDIIEEKRPKKKNRMGQRERQKYDIKHFNKHFNNIYFKNDSIIKLTSPLFINNNNNKLYS